MTTPQLPAWTDQPYSIKRHGVTITNCDSEPVQIPGCIQDHGALLVLNPLDLTIVQASENSESVFHHSPQDLFGQSVTAVIGPVNEAKLKNLLATEPLDRNPIYAFSLPSRDRAAAPLDVSVHTIDGAVVVEFEATDLLSAIQPDYYSLVKKTVTRLQTTTTLRQFSDAVVEEIRALTGYDRVMVYQFHADNHGEVFAESKKVELESWLGFHYPAEDIPQPARDMFRKIWLRPMSDVSGGLAELVPLVNPLTGKPLDMSYCALRGASIMYTEYLKNMKVTAGLTLSIRRDDKLWGLIACHHYSGPRHLSYQVRAACEFLAQVISLQHKAAEERESFVYRLNLEGAHQQVVAATTRENNLAALIDGTPNLLSGMDAGGVALYHLDRWWLTGQTPTQSELEGLAEWLFERPDFLSSTQPIYVTDCLSSDYPPAKAFANIASGVMAVPLSRTQKNLMLWFRPETIQTLSWAGDPHAKHIVPGPHGPRLTPRLSFELFKESVHLRALPWKTVEIDAVLRLRLLVMELVVNRAEQIAQLNVALARSNEELDAFAYVASHDLKEPLRGIHKYAYQLLEDAAVVEGEQRLKLESLMRLTKRMDTLLDSLLYFSKVGRTTLSFEDVDLAEILEESAEMAGSRITDSQRQVLVPRPLPRAVCDRIRIREVFVNLLSNGLKYNDSPLKHVEVGYFEPNTMGDSIPLAAHGHGIYYFRDNGIGIAEKHKEQVFKMFKRLHGPSEYGGGTGAGLTIVKKVIERHGGHIWFESTLGQGTTFYFTLNAEVSS